jgi:phosphoribosyl-ATP pyrophosphohydrolase/phosphoribosyl-AMP cyclohydrolase
MLDLEAIDFAKGGGLVTVVTQDATTGAVLMVAHADRDALERTIASGEMHYRSRTRGAWHKGATSGNVQRVVSLTADCDGDAVLARVRPAGPACHTGALTCFGAPSGDALSGVAAVIAARAEEMRDAAGEAGGTATGSRDDAARETSYTRRLLADRNLRLKKLGEEASELVTACADGDAARATEETADLLYHALVALQAAGGSLDGVRAVLAARAK